jgi:hypothetical protein
MMKEMDVSEEHIASIFRVRVGEVRNQREAGSK